MKPDRGGIRRLALLLLASLLLHLAVLFAVSGNYRRNPADTIPSLPMRVDYVDSVANRESAPQNPPLRPAVPRRVAPVSRPVTTPLPVMPTAGISPPRLTGGAATSPVPAPSVPRDAAAGMAGTEMGVGPADRGTRKGTGSESGASGGTGSAPDRRGGEPGRAQGSGAPASGAAQATGQQRAAYQALLKRLVEAHKEYPFAARRLRQEGSCQRRFVLGRNGTIKQIEALSSCGHLLLDEAATRAITTVGMFPPLPDDFRGAEETFTITMTFTLARH